MSKTIRLTDEIKKECLEEFGKALLNMKISDGKLVFNKVFPAINRKATVVFTEEAWLKMRTLVEQFEKEVAWHGVAERSKDESVDEYIISDILVYPQSVTGATVDMDVEGYGRWITENQEDERFFKLKMQGHSHVDMAVNPSGTDLSHQEEILSQLRDDSFYIFMIWNKSNKRNIKIYDLAKNVLFEDSDIDVKLADGAMEINKFLKEAKETVKEKTYTTSKTNYSGVYSGGYYGGYGGNYGGYYSHDYYDYNSDYKGYKSSGKEEEKKKEVQKDNSSANKKETDTSVNDKKNDKKKKKKKKISVIPITFKEETI